MDYDSIQWPYPKDQHAARVLINDPQAQAYEWILAYANSLSENATSYDDEIDSLVTAGELINYGLMQIDNPDGWNYLSKGGLLEGVSTDPLFWDKLGIFMSVEIPPSIAGSNFFSCSC